MEPYGGLITKGLGLPACQGMITASFTLLGCTVDVVVPPPLKYTPVGGSRPFAPGEIHNFYKPVGSYRTPSWQPLPVPLPVTDPKTHVHVHVKIGGKTIDKDFLVRRDRAAVIVKIINAANTTLSKATDVITNIRSRASSIIIAIKNIKSHK